MMNSFYVEQVDFLHLPDEVCVHVLKNSEEVEWRYMNKNIAIGYTNCLIDMGYAELTAEEVMNIQNNK